MLTSRAQRKLVELRKKTEGLSSLEPAKPRSPIASRQGFLLGR